MMVFFFRVPACCSRSCTVTQRIFKNCTLYLKSIGVTYTRFIFYNLREDCTPLMPHQLSAASGSPCCMLLLKPQRTGCFPWNSCQLPWQLESLSGLLLNRNIQWEISCLHLRKIFLVAFWNSWVQKTCYITFKIHSYFYKGPAKFLIIILSTNLTKMSKLFNINDAVE